MTDQGQTPEYVPQHLEDEAEQDVIYAGRVEKELADALAEIKPTWARWANYYVGACRSNCAETCRVTGVPERTGRSWLIKPKIRRYMVALIKREALRLMVTRTTIISGLAYIAMVDPAELFEMLPETPEQHAQRLLASGIPRHLRDEMVVQRANLEARDIPLVPTVRNIKELPQRVTRAIKSITIEHGAITKVVFHDKVKALQLLGTAWQMFEGSQPIDEPRDAPWTGFTIIAPEEEKTP